MSALSLSFRVGRNRLVSQAHNAKRRCAPCLQRFSSSPRPAVGGSSGIGVKYQRSVLYPVNIRHVPSSRQFSADVPGNTDAAIDLSREEELNKSLLKACEQGDPAEAEKILNRANKILGDQGHLGYPDLDAYTAVMDCWLEYQNNLENQSPDNVEELYVAAQRAESILRNMRRRSSPLSVQDGENDASVRPQSHNFDAVLMAFTRVCRAMQREDTYIKGVPQRAQRVLEQMEGHCRSSSVSEVKPTVESYNRVMECWGCSNEHLRATMAQDVFQKLFEEPALSLGIRPSHETFRIMMRTWCKSGQKRAAFNATGHLMHMHKKMLDFGIEEMEPTLEEYHMILEAWTKASDKYAPQKAQTVLKLIEDAYISRASEIRPDEICYKYILQTISNSALPGLGPDVDKFLELMIERQITPDAACYSAAVRAWSNSALHRLCENPHEDALRANELLKEMEDAYHKSSTAVIKTNIDDYNAVVHAWSASSKAGAAQRAESILLQLEGMAQEGDESLRPTHDTYTWTLQTWAMNESSDKINRATAILERFKENSDLEPNVDVFNAFIEVCATAVHGKEADKKVALSLAIRTVEEMRGLGVSPNPSTFRVLLQACANLLPAGRDRAKAVENVFKNCCVLGLVDKKVLQQFRGVATNDQYLELVVAASSGDDETGRMVPETWTRNLSFKVLTVDGRKPPPLSLENGFFFTPAMKEFKMRKLRRRKNQRLLRGGRLH